MPRRRIIRGDGVAGRRFGRLLRAWRKASGRSGREVARLAGVSSAYYCHLEAGVVNPPSPTVCRGLAEALEVPEADVLAVAGHVPPLVLQAFQRHGLDLMAAARGLLGRRAGPTRPAGAAIPGEDDEPDPDLGRDEK